MVELDVLAFKQKLSPHLLKIPGVTGVGVGQAHVRVYLKADDPNVRHAVKRAVAAHAPDAPIAFEVTGAFDA